MNECIPIKFSIANGFFSVRLAPLLCAASLVALLVGCAVGPDFERPTAPKTSDYDSDKLPAETASVDTENGGAQSFANGKDVPAEWWALYHSEPLNKLIKQSIRANPDLAAAQAALRQAQESYAAGTGALFPTVSAGFDTTRQKTSGAAFGGSFPGFLYTLHTASVSVSYGLDLFGGTRRGIEELEAGADYQRFQLEAAYLSLTGNVVTTAVNEASLRGQIAATKKILAEEDKQLDVIQRQLDVGAINKAPLLALRATREQTRATLPPLEKQLSQTRHLLSVLIGQLPSSPPEAAFDLANLQLPQTLPLSIPSQLVEQRPDVRAAEANLHAASADIGVAIANRLPQFTLSADMGSESNNLGKLFTSGTGIWSAGFSIAQTIFDAGTLEHKQGAAEAAFDVAAAQYRKTVLAAFQDVADVLRALQSDAETLKIQIEAERVATESLAVFKQQYEAGSASYLDVLSAEQTEQQTRIATVQAEAQRLADTAALFQALGGGWWNRTSDKTDISSAENKSVPPAGPDVSPNGDKND